MNETMTMLFGLTGGLALFLFGMNSMSDALQKAAGERMKRILSFLTKTPVMGALAGALVTAVLQSSSATTVMVIGFTSAGLMSLPQAISVIFGANIGTTMTAQLLAFKLSDYIYPIIFIGFLLNFAGKKEKLKSIGMVIFSFGLLFEGIEIMGSVMAPLAGSPVFVELMDKVSHLPVLGILLGAGMTLIVQSSSATIAVLQNFASQPGPDGVHSIIGLTGAIPILLGDNIGTTITALLASIGQSKNARRTALSHSIFNISGSIVFACFIPLFARFVTFLSPKGNEIDVISRQIANAHTLFNLVCTLVWLPLIPLMVRIVTTLIRGDDQQPADELRPQFLDNNVLNQPMAAMYLISKEINRCSGEAARMMKAAQQELTGDPNVPAEAFDAPFRLVKGLQNAIVAYINRLFSSGLLTEGQSELVAGLLFITNSLDRIADRCQEMVAAGRQLKSSGKALSGNAVEDLTKCFLLSDDMFHGAMDAVNTGNEAYIRQIPRELAAMKKAQKKFTKAHLSRLKKKTCDASISGSYTQILYCLDRIADSCAAISESAADHITFIHLRNPIPSPQTAETSGQPKE